MREAMVDGKMVMADSETKTLYEETAKVQPILTAKVE